MLELKDIHKIYNPGTVNEMCLFDGFNLKVEKGGFAAVVGSNGSGKTSMLNIICGSIPVDSGAIYIGKENITHMPEFKNTNGMPKLAGCTRILPWERARL